MGRIRRWLRGTLRADRFEADEVDAGSVNTEEATTDSTKYVKDDENIDDILEDSSIDRVVLSSGTYEIQDSTEPEVKQVVGGGWDTVIQQSDGEQIVWSNVEYVGHLKHLIPVDDHTRNGARLGQVGAVWDNVQIEVVDLGLGNVLQLSQDEQKAINCELTDNNADRDALRIVGDDCFAMGNDIDDGVRVDGSGYPTPFGDYNNIR